ncbi:hypothetical protein V6N11_066602 [Hibiscus sabdariffa]|uniref:Uncharacterized protein n=2 Tax=Hibiscus sabdariffa TaxID=183260 RepID=A0ABR2AAA1_9ROSI
MKGQSNVLEASEQDSTQEMNMDGTLHDKEKPPKMEEVVNFNEEGLTSDELSEGLPPRRKVDEVSGFMDKEELMRELPMGNGALYFVVEEEPMNSYL